MPKKVVHPKYWSRTKRSRPRWFWFQKCDAEGGQINVRKFCSFESTFRFGDAMIAGDSSIDCLFLIDGNLPESELVAPPIDRIWNRWERYPFEEDGKPCVMLAIQGTNVMEIR